MKYLRNPKPHRETEDMRDDSSPEWRVLSGLFVLVIHRVTVAGPPMANVDQLGLR